MRFACSTASFPLESLERAVARAAWAGFPAIEIELPEGDVAAVEDPDDLKTRLRANEVELAAVRAGELGAEDAGAALKAAGRVGRAAVLAQKLDGSRIIVAAPAEGRIEHLAAGLATLADVLTELPVRICVANRAGTLLAAPQEMADLNRRLVSSRLEFALDPAEAVLAGWDPARTLDRFHETPAHVYLNDAAGTARMPPGEGHVDWPRLAAALRERGFAGCVTLRLAGADPWAVETVAKEALALAAEWFGADG